MELTRHVYAAHSVDIGMLRSRDALDLPHHALTMRKRPADQQLAFAEKIVKLLIVANQRDELRALAEALHLIAIKLTEVLTPAAMSDLLRIPIQILSNASKQNPELWPYVGLLLRSESLAANKSDNYVRAFSLIDRAYSMISSSPRADQLTKYEAGQQNYLQESGQQARNVETALVEPEMTLRLRHHEGATPQKHLDRDLPGGIQSLQIVARAAELAGRRSWNLLRHIEFEYGALPSNPDPEERQLAGSAWKLTCGVMFARAALLGAFVEICAGGTPTTYLETASRVYAAVLENPTAPTANNRMDLTRFALMWAFLNGGTNPYVPSIAGGSPSSKMPSYLSMPLNGRLDIVACAAALDANGHDAGILDNFAHYEPFEVLRRQSGEGANTLFDRWNSLRRTPAHAFHGGADAELKRQRVPKRPPGQMLKVAADVIKRTPRYRPVLRDL